MHILHFLLVDLLFSFRVSCINMCNTHKLKDKLFSHKMINLVSKRLKKEILIQKYRIPDDI